MMKSFSFWLRLLFSVGLIAFLAYTVDLDEAVTIIARANPIHLLIALAFALGDRLIMAFKWNVLLKAKKIEIPLLDITGTYLITTFLGLFLPATVGGDALRAYAVCKDKHKVGDVVSSIIVERILGFMALFIFVLVSIVLSIFVFGQDFFEGVWNLFWIFLALLIGSIVFIVVSFNEKFLRYTKVLLNKRAGKLLEHKFAKKLIEIYDSYKGYQGNLLALGLFLGLSLIENLFPLFWTYFLALAFQIEIPLLYFFILIPIVLVLVRLPISLDGFGIQEGTFVYFLGLVGIMRPEALLLGLASHFLAIISVLPGGLLYSIRGLNFHVIPSRHANESIFQRPVDVAADTLHSKIDA